MNAPKKDKKDLLGDLENIKDLLDSSSPGDDSFDETALSDSQSLEHTADIPLLSDVVPLESQTVPEHTTNTPEKTGPSSDPHQPDVNEEIPRPADASKANPFIPYEAINKLKQERKSMRNFAAEVMEAAQLGMAKKDLDQFDLFKYSQASKTSQSNEIPNHHADIKSDQFDENTPGIPTSKTLTPSSITPPTEEQLNVIIDEVIESHRSLLEEALRDALHSFYEQSLNKNAPNQ